MRSMFSSSLNTKSKRSPSVLPREVKDFPERRYGLSEKNASKSRFLAVATISVFSLLMVLPFRTPKASMPQSLAVAAQESFPADYHSLNASKTLSPTLVSTKTGSKLGQTRNSRTFLSVFTQRFSTSTEIPPLPKPLSPGKKKKRRRKKAGPLLELPQPPDPDDEDTPSGTFPLWPPRFSPDGTDSCHPSVALLRLYMYPLPPEFHYGMLNLNYTARWPNSVTDIPRYKGGMNLQHSPEYWLTADLLTSSMADRSWKCTVVRVEDPLEADLVWVPFFSSLAYNLFSSGGRKKEGESKMDMNMELENRLVHFLQDQPLWNKSGGRDHILTVHHPNSMWEVREKLSSATFILADFGRCNGSVANSEKDIIAPYKHVVETFEDDGNEFHLRPTLLFFQGMIVRKDGGVIRQKLYELINHEEGVIFTEGSTRKDGIRSATQGMRLSKFCLHLAGDTPSSNRLFDAIVSHCVPVIISDELELPFEDWLDYSSFSIFVRGEDSLIPGFLMNLLRGISPEQWTQMWGRLKQVQTHFEYRYPSYGNDAVQMVWHSIAKKIPTIRLAVHKRRRFQYGDSMKEKRITGKTL